MDLVEGKLHKPVPQNIISAGQDQSKDFLTRCLNHIAALGKATPAGDIVENSSALIVKLNNGIYLRAFSSNPKTIRSYEGDVTLDEFGATPNPDKVWAAASPMAKPTLGNPIGYNIRVVGTPEGDDNLFWRICKGDLRPSWSVHEVDIYAAIKDGFPLRGTIDDLRTEIGDSDTFAQEYECNFLAASMRYISAAIYDAAVYHDGDIPDGTATRFAGMDVARKKHLSAIVIGEKKGDTVFHMDTQVEQGMAWDDQEEWVGRVIEDRIRRIAVDSTGLGSQFSERLAKAYPGRVEGVVFTAPMKEELATGFKLALERHRFRPKAGDRELRRDVLSLKRIITTAGNVRFDANDDSGSHADRAWAAALMVHAAGGAVGHAGAPTIHRVGKTRADSLMGGKRGGPFKRR